MKLVVLESSDIKYEEKKCTSKQFDYLQSLMSKTKHQELWETTLGLTGRNRLTKQSASKLIDILIKKEMFELRELKHTYPKRILSHSD